MAYRHRFVAIALVLLPTRVLAGYVNFESSHVHPIALTPGGGKLLVVNTPDARLEVFTLGAAGQPVPSASIPVGLEPVTVVARTDGEAWVVNNLSDTVSIVDLTLGTTVRTIRVGDAPTDVVFAQGKAFVAVSHEDAVKVYDLANLSAAPIVVPLFASRIRALAVSHDGNRVYAVAQDSGNQTTVVNANVIANNDSTLSAIRLAALGLNDMRCNGAPPPYPPLPDGMVRNPALVDPPDGVPKVGLIVKWDAASSAWKDDAGQDWTHCLPFRLPDHDLFAIDAANPANPPTAVDHLGTTLFEVSVNPASGKIYVPHTDARNFVRFEPRLKGHFVDNRLAIVDPGAGNSVNLVELNAHVNFASDPATNLAERLASISQPGMMVWRADGSVGYLTAIGSRKLFAVDGSCASPSCIFGPLHHQGRATPDAVEVGEGPTGVALLEAQNRLYVLNRFSNSIALVDAATLTKLGEIPLHDPSSATVKQGRRFLYDAILSSGHGDSSCASCHPSGDKDGLAWDLGDPTGSLVPYSTPNDNVRFVGPLGGGMAPCDPANATCSTHAGFDPQKGPLVTQTLRAMLEPLHWRGDRATVNDFNPTFVSLLAAHDVGPVNGKPAGLSAADMEALRQFALGMRFPPSPVALLAGDPPGSPIPIPETGLSGNPAAGRNFMLNGGTDPQIRCLSCHNMNTGTTGGVLGGVTPQQPTSLNAAAVMNGTLVGSPHNDLKIPQLRNLVDRAEFVVGPPGGPYPDAKTGFGFGHDGSFPNLPTFFSRSVFTISATNALNFSAFMLSFFSEVVPAEGQHVTVPPGAPPTGTAGDESLLASLISLGDLTSVIHSCELTATTPGADRLRSYRLSGGAWLSDVAGAPALSTAQLREGAQGPINFLCATRGSGVRLGGDRDEDAILDGDDCAPADAEAWASPMEVSGPALEGTQPVILTWSDQSAAIGAGVRYGVAGGLLSALSASGLSTATGCLADDVATASFADSRPNPDSGDGYFYLIRAQNVCAAGGFGAGRTELDALACGAP